jgi:hypothetical protein
MKTENTNSTNSANEAIAAFETETTVTTVKTPTEEGTTEEGTTEEVETNKEEVIASLRKEISMKSHLGLNTEERESVEKILADAFPDTTGFAVKKTDGLEFAAKTEKLGRLPRIMLLVTGENPRINDEVGYDIEPLAKDILKNGLNNPIHVVENKPDTTGIANQGTKAPFYIVVDGHRRLTAIDHLLNTGQIDCNHPLILSIPIFKTSINWTQKNWRSKVKEYMLAQSYSTKSLTFVEEAAALGDIAMHSQRSANEYATALGCKAARIKQLLELIKLTYNDSDIYRIIRDKGYSLSDVISKIKGFYETFKVENLQSPTADDVLLFVSEATVTKRGRTNEKNLSDEQKAQLEADRIANAEKDAQDAIQKAETLKNNASDSAKEKLSNSQSDTDNTTSDNNNVPLTMEQKFDKSDVKTRLGMLCNSTSTMLAEKFAANEITKEQYDNAKYIANIISDVSIMATSNLNPSSTFELEVLNLLGLSVITETQPDVI